MVKTVQLSTEIHKSLKLAATNKDMSLSTYLEHVIESHARLSILAADLSQMKKGDVYRLDIGDKLIVLQAEDVHEFEN